MIGTKKIIGIDIADDAIALVEGRRKGAGINVINTSYVEIPKGVVKKGVIQDEKKLSGIFKRALSQAKPNAITATEGVFGIPDSQTYVQQFDIGNSLKDIDYEIQQHVREGTPIQSSNIVYSYIKYKGHSRTNIFAIAVNKEILDQWKAFFIKNDVNIIDVNTEALASHNALVQEMHEDATYALIDIGATTTQITIFSSGTIRFSYSLFFAGDHITEQIQGTLGVNWQEATEKKHAVGLTDPNDQLFTIIINALQPIINGIKDSFTAYESLEQKRPEKIILIGGTAKLNSLKEYIETNLSISTFVPKKENVQFVQATGLSMKGFGINSNPFTRELRMLQTQKVSKTNEGVQKRETSRGNREVLVLFLVLLFGALLVGGIYYFKNVKDTAVEPSIVTVESKNDSQENIFYQEQQLQTVISSLSVDNRLLLDYVPEEKPSNSKIAIYKDGIQSRLVDAERVWAKPLSQTVTPDGTELIWLIYSVSDLELEAKELVQNSLSISNVEILEVEVINVEEIPSSSLYSFSVDITYKQT